MNKMYNVNVAPPQIMKTLLDFRQKLKPSPEKGDAGQRCMSIQKFSQYAIHYFANISMVGSLVGLRPRPTKFPYLFALIQTPYVTPNRAQLACELPLFKVAHCPEFLRSTNQESKLTKLFVHF